MDDELLVKDLANVLDDIAEAVATGREPEDVQRERHERERAEVAAITRGSWWTRRFAK